MKLGPTSLKLIRVFLRKSDKKKHKAWPPKEAYRSLLDVDALGDGVFEHQIDVYYAPESIRKNVTLIDIHGGAYIYGDRKNNFGFASVFLDKGYDVVTLDYGHNDLRRHGCQDQVATLGKQLAYVAGHAEELGLNPRRFFLTGDSAGGHFALLLAEAACDPELEKRLGLDLGGIQIHGVAVSCPVYDLKRNVGTAMLSKSGKKMMFGPRYDDPSFVTDYSPREHLDSLHMPTFVISCAKDFLKQESLDLVADMKEKDMDVEFHFVDKDDSAIGHVFNVIDIHLDESKTANEATDLFFSRC